MYFTQSYIYFILFTIIFNTTIPTTTTMHASSNIYSILSISIAAILQAIYLHSKNV